METVKRARLSAPKNVAPSVVGRIFRTRLPSAIVAERLLTKMNKCYECGWSDTDSGFFTEEAGKMYCSLHRSLSMQELLELTHETQVERFGFCTCEEQENFPYSDCPRNGVMA